MYDMEKLKNLSILGEGGTKSISAFWAFDKAALADGEIPRKYKKLIALAVAFTTQCPYCLAIHKDAALKALTTKIQGAIGSKSLSGVKIAMITNGNASYWNEAKAGWNDAMMFVNSALSLARNASWRRLERRR